MAVGWGDCAKQQRLSSGSETQMGLFRTVLQSASLWQGKAHWANWMQTGRPSSFLTAETQSARPPQQVSWGGFWQKLPSTVGG
jgi:hypothetical protein